MLNLIKSDLQNMVKDNTKTPERGFRAKSVAIGMTFAQAAQEQVSAPQVTQTDNGNIAFSTAGTAIIDFFFQGGAMRNWRAERKRIAFSKAYAEDKLLALKMLFYFRDIRSGQGERDLFRHVISDLAVYDPNTVRKNIHLFSEYGRWDDLFSLLGTTLEKDVFELIAKQLEADWTDEFPSLLAKWMKSENASSKSSRKIAQRLAKGLGLTPKEYRLMLTKLRAKINIIETKISKGEYASIDYSQIPSNAAMKYRKAFYRHDEKRYSEYLEALSKPVEDRPVELKAVKVNAKTLYPNEIAGKLLDSIRGYGRSNSAQEVSLFESQWKALPDYFNGKTENMLVIADTSGSMIGTPMNVAVSLAIYAAERNVGKFHGTWMNFSSNPSFQTLQGDSLYEKIRNLDYDNWDMSTDINKALDLVLRTGLQFNLPQSEMPAKIVIISDMQFDRCVQNAFDGGLLNTVAKKFALAGYEMPQIVFFNVDATAGTAPTFSQQGIALVSGFSPSIFQSLFGDLGTPMDVVFKTVNIPRYDAITI